MNILNFTPHTVNIVNDNGDVVRTYPTNGVARVNTSFEAVSSLDGVLVLKTSYGSVDGLPEPVKETVYIVSMVVAQALPNRNDLVCPNTAPNQTVRDASGQIIGVKSFAKY